MNNYLLFCLYVLVTACTTPSGSDLDDAVDTVGSIYLLQCGVDPCEGVQYDKSKIQKISGSVSTGRVNPGEVLLPAFAGKSYLQVEEKAKLIANQLVTSKNPEVPKEVLLSLALSAAKDGKKALSFYLLDRLLGSKNKKIRSAAYNAYGVGVFRENRVMDAISFWKKSLQEEPENRAAQLNLAIVSLHNHRFSGISDIGKNQKNEWMFRLLSSLKDMEQGKSGDAETVCSDLLEVNSHILVQYNCGILLSRNPAYKDRAKKILLTVNKDKKIPDSKRKILSDILSKL